MESDQLKKKRGATVEKKNLSPSVTPHHRGSRTELEKMGECDGCRAPPPFRVFRNQERKRGGTDWGGCSKKFSF